MKAIITVGISGSGKSTWAENEARSHHMFVVCRDDLRFTLTKARNWNEFKFDKEFEKMVTALQHRVIESCAARKKSVIIADTNLNPETRQKWIVFCEALGFDVVVKDFPITLEEAWKRDSLRINGVGREVLYKQWQQWLVYTQRKKYTPNTSLPKAIVFDIDGTLAHKGDRNPFDWSKVGDDKVDTIVRGILWNFLHNKYKIVLLSGRDSVCREQTFQWCSDNDIPYDSLSMRAEKDIRKDSVVKEEMFWRDIAPYYNVEAIVDDRPQVVRMWYDLGIPKVVCVGNPFLEF